MYNDYRYLAVIPARGGSKGIHRKNLVNLNGRPLIAYSIESALNSKYIDSVVVSTDDEEIAKVSTSYGANVIKRPAELAGDTSVIVEAILHALLNINQEYDFVILLQPTSPLRLSEHIDNAVELLDEKGFTSLVSISPVNDHPLLVREREMDGTLKKVISQRSSVRRQEMPLYFRINGAIYINRVSELNQNSNLNDNKVGYVMPKENSIDIDDTIDLIMAESIINFYHFYSETINCNS